MMSARPSNHHHPLEWLGDGPASGLGMARRKPERCCDIRAEFMDAAGRMTAPRWTWLERVGVGPDVWKRARMVGAGTVLPDVRSADGATGFDPGWPAAGTYLPGSVGSERQRGCLILGVWSRLYVAELEPWAHREFGAAELYDLVAIDVRDPSRWWMRRGGGFSPPTWLGQGFGPAVGDETGTIDLHPTPLDWLRAGCTGKVLLDGAGWPLDGLFSGVKHIRVADPKWGLRLYKDLRAGERKKHPEILAHAGVATGFKDETKRAAA